ncbi:MAG: hypothetical protein H0U54_19085, partial [Acidobacteria bacterium]|nr:hypothetical protein [Acidobacteriota bacterium]
MKKLQQSPIITWLTLFSLLLTMSSGIMLGDKAYAKPLAKRSDSSAQGHDKVSADLREKVKNAKNG